MSSKTVPKLVPITYKVSLKKGDKEVTLKLVIDNLYSAL